MDAFLRGLVHQMIHEGRNANEHIGLKIANKADIAFGAHHFTAAGT